MITKEKYLAAVHNEFRIIKHLITKIPAAGHDYRPSEKQRSTLELLAYLSAIGSSMMTSLLTGTWPEDYQARIESVTIENVSEKIDEEEAKIAELFPRFTDAMMDESVDLFGMGFPETKSEYLLDLLQILSAYKMQLFLYAKASGNHDIGTSNAWGGRDM